MTPARPFGYSWLERVNLYATIPFLLLTILHLTGIWRPSFSQYDLLVLILGDVLFFNVTHIALAYWQFLALPEMKEWRKTRTRRQIWEVGTITFLAGAVPFAGIMSVSYFGVKGLTQDIVVIGTLVITQYLRTQHIVYQHMGLSLLYNVDAYESPKLTESDRTQLKRSELFERWGFHAFVLISCCYFLSTYFSSIFPESVRDTLADARKPLQLVLILLALAIPANAWLNRSTRKTEKPLFLSRLIFYPFVDWVSPLAIRFFHGIEYLVIYCRMQAHSESRHSDIKRTILPMGLLVSVAVILGLLYFRHYPFDRFNMFKKRDFLVATLASLSLASGYVHFYFDRIMFQMKDPHTRRLIGPLIRKL